MKPETKKLLLSFDEVNALEYPGSFNAKDIEKRARKVFSELCDYFPDLKFEDWVYNQDASFGLAIVFKPSAEKNSETFQQAAIRFSNFGNLATIIHEELLPDDSRKIIVDSLSKNGFTFVDAEEIDEVYDGVLSPNESITTWQIRYFDWI